MDTVTCTKGLAQGKEGTLNGKGCGFAGAALGLNPVQPLY